MQKTGKIMLIILIALVGVFCFLGYDVYQEIGAQPTLSQQEEFKKLPYYQNGVFISPEIITYEPQNVRNGPFKWSDWLFRSRFAPKIKLPQIKPVFDETPSKEISLYWLGHSSVIAEVNQKRLVIDPVLNNASPIPFAVPRYDESVIKAKDFPLLDYVLITHNHYDHLDRKTIKALNKKTKRFIVPLGVDSALIGWGIPADKITALGWGDSFEEGDFKITAEIARHYSRRGINDTNKTLWNSYVVESGDKKIFFAGDTGYGKHFAQIGAKYQSFDLAVIEIDGWNTGWRYTHSFPHEVAQVFYELNAQRLLPVHWAVFDLALHPWHESIDMLLDEMKEIKEVVLTPKMGEKITIYPQNQNFNHKKWWQDLE